MPLSVVTIKARVASGDRKKFIGWNVPWPMLRCTGENTTVGGLGGVGKGRTAARVAEFGHSGATAGEPTASGENVVVAIRSMPVLSRPKKKSSPVGSRFGINVPPNKVFKGTLPAGTSLRKAGAPGKSGGAGVKTTAELSQVL